MSTQKILVDVSAGTSVADWLRAFGQDVVAVRDLDPRMSDTDILTLAVREQRLVITMDKDFGELVYRSGRHRGDGRMTSLGVGLLGSQVALVVHGLTDAAIWGQVRTGVLVWAIWGLWEFTFAIAWDFYVNFTTACFDRLLNFAVA